MGSSFRPPVLPLAAKTPCATTTQVAGGGCGGGGSGGGGDGAAPPADGAKGVVRVFSALYCKRGPQKRKNWQDGILTIDGIGRVVLRDPSDRQVGQSRPKPSELQAFVAHAEGLDVGCHEVNLEQERPLAEFTSGHIFTVGAGGAPSGPPLPPPPGSGRALKPFVKVGGSLGGGAGGAALVGGAAYAKPLAVANGGGGGGGGGGAGGGGGGGGAGNELRSALVARTERTTSSGFVRPKAPLRPKPAGQTGAPPSFVPVEEGEAVILEDEVEGGEASKGGEADEGGGKAAPGGASGASFGSGRPLVVLKAHCAGRLRPHQIDGVRFLLRCLAGRAGIPSGGRGAVLADDMG